MRKARYDLRTPRGLVECALYLLQQFGHKKRGEDPRPASVARRTACALFSVASILDERIGPETRHQFWDSFLAVQQSVDFSPLEWQQAIDQLKQQHPAILEAAAVDNKDTTAQLIDIATTVMSETEPVRTLGLVFLEIAESRRLHCRNPRWQRILQLQVTERLTATRLGVGAHRIFQQLTSFRPKDRRGKEFAISPDGRVKGAPVRYLSADLQPIDIAGMPPPGPAEIVATIATAPAPLSASSFTEDSPAQGRLF